jgi:CBS-domain-containing membrane protein
MIKFQDQRNADDVDPDDVDALLAKELNQMTFQQRELMYEEIHGVDQIHEETEDFLNARLAALEQEIRRLPERELYEQAERISKAYVTDRKFRLMFLRAEYHDPRKAAVRLVRFLEGKVQFFGPETLARNLYLSDLDDDDFAFLKSGILQLIPVRDRAGRAIFADFNMQSQSSFRCKSVDNVVISFLSYHLSITVWEFLTK